MGSPSIVLVWIWKPWTHSYLNDEYRKMSGKPWVKLLALCLKCLHGKEMKQYDHQKVSQLLHSKILKKGWRRLMASNKIYKKSCDHVFMQTDTDEKHYLIPSHLPPCRNLSFISKHTASDVLHRFSTSHDLMSKSWDSSSDKRTDASTILLSGNNHLPVMWKPS